MHTTFGMGTVVGTGAADDVVVLGAATGAGGNSVVEELTGAFVVVSADVRAWVVVDG
ncbi:hypothetical protein [Rhodococcus sp. B50]|uniref:hypothetical protein n=1 Tax=Rhodococcus sp. B50 TaxID=2682847 RepID=UPI0019F60F0B|nr:hypothetical protein [Rhodococcus sp. B50]